jgi:hypothetical protein
MARVADGARPALGRRRRSGNPLWSRFKLRWAVLPSSAVPTVQEDARPPIVRPARWPVGAAARKSWFKSTLEPLVKSSGTYGPLQIEALEELSALEALAGPGRVRWAPIGELLTEDPLPAGIVRVPATPPDLSPWIGEPEENRAWELLGLARQAIEDYQNSGDAGMNALDLAKKEIHAAEDGRVFYELGSEGNADRGGDVRREFLATLNQVYQLMGAPSRRRSAGGSRAAPRRAKAKPSPTALSNATARCCAGATPAPTTGARGITFTRPVPTPPGPGTCAPSKCGPARP